MNSEELYPVRHKKYGEFGILFRALEAFETFEDGDPTTASLVRAGEFFVTEASEDEGEIDDTGEGIVSFGSEESILVEWERFSPSRANA